MSWKDTIQDEKAVEAKSSWRDTIQEEPQETSQLESGARGLAQGASFGYADEITGGLEALYDVATTDKELSDLGDVYEQRRDESRANYAQAEEDNPLTYGAGQIGGAVGTAFVPGLGGASLGKLAVQGAAHASGASEADNMADLAKDTAIGAGTGLALGGAGKLVSKGASAIGRAGKEIIEDVATAPITKGASDGVMGMLPKALKTVGKYGDKFDDVFSSLTKKAVGKTGNETVDTVLNQAAKKGSYFIPGVGKAVAAADAASAVPGAAQATAQFTTKGLEKLAPYMGKFGPLINKAAQRGGNSLAASHFVLQQTSEEYRKALEEAQGKNDEREE